ncbi:hypothetical protein G7Y89_g11100 [Cudoniella acicularis]|uniref:Centrosomin N-terminal motif 1 domain-containing protein n=1 Tax=Cudoniella acicularis TaxID=354080 RepID=A0A8H4REA2_9HELO|nr:hypothetical protein G7Y89_g11100 [Cudoniella acicularis]
MEDSSQGSRRSRTSRPDSSASSHTRMTPTSSSNSSSAHLPPRTNSFNSPRLSTGGANLLHERLRERKVESARQMRRGSMDLSSLADRGIQSSPVKAHMAREERRPSSGGGKGMGVKQIEEVGLAVNIWDLANHLQQVSTLHKQNFDLKLELYHRRQRQETLEARLAAAEKQLEEQAEMQEVNEQLVAELEKRDQAVEEAVSLIVTLEDKVERLMKEREGVRAFEAEYKSTYFRPDDELPSSPPRYPRSINSVPRMPSFLSEQSEGTEALRSLYLPSHGQSEVTLPKMAESTQDGMDSPRLSVLSESSFVSVYGEKPLDLNDPSDSPSPPRRDRTASAVEKWIDERPAATATPVRAPALQKSQFLSINSIIESPLQRLEKLKNTLDKTNNSIISMRQQPERSSAREKRRAKLADQTSFERQQALPPTPDTFSTGTLKRFDSDTGSQKKDDTFLESSGSTFTTHHDYPSKASVRPRSAGETVTSRRDGHGWDTDTQADYTEAGSISSLASLYNGPLYRQPHRVMTPELFTFGGSEDPKGWGRDVLFNNAPELPKRPRHQVIRRASLAEHPRSDDTISARRARLNQQEAVQQAPTDMTKQPNLPDRRSSLSATTKLRKVQNAIPESPKPPPVTVSPTKEKDSKIFRLSGRLFGRSDTAPASPVGKVVTARSPSYFADAPGDEARATPPPIKRNRTSQGYRPSSAGMGSGRRPSTFGFETPEGTRPVNPEVEAEGDGRSSGGKKWFGMGRTNSLRKT